MPVIMTRLLRGGIKLISGEGMRDGERTRTNCHNRSGNECYANTNRVNGPLGSAVTLGQHLWKT